MIIDSNSLIFFSRSQLEGCGEYKLELRLEFYDGSVRGKKRNFEIFIHNQPRRKLP